MGPGGYLSGTCPLATLWSPPRLICGLEFVTRPMGPKKTRAPGPFPRPPPLNSLGRGVFFGIRCPCPRSSPRPTHTPDGCPLKIRGNKRGPGPGWGVDYAKIPSPAPCKGGVWRVKNPPAPPCKDQNSWPGPYLLSPIFNGDPGGVWVARAPEWGQGQGMSKKTSVGYWAGGGAVSPVRAHPYTGLEGQCLG